VICILESLKKHDWALFQTLDLCYSDSLLYPPMSLSDPQNSDKGMRRDSLNYIVDLPTFSKLAGLHLDTHLCQTSVPKSNIALYYTRLIQKPQTQLRLLFLVVHTDHTCNLEPKTITSPGFSCRDRTISL